MSFLCKMVEISRSSVMIYSYIARAGQVEWVSDLVQDKSNRAYLKMQHLQSFGACQYGDMMSNAAETHTLNNISGTGKWPVVSTKASS